MDKFHITCTPLAIKIAKDEIGKRNNPLTKGIRLGLRAGGCNGFSLTIEFADNINENDNIFTFDDVLFIIDPKSMIYLNGSEITYETKLLGRGFKLQIPKQSSTCSCGQSIQF